MAALSWATTLWVGALLSTAAGPGCTSTSGGSVASGPGESCARTADCQGGMFCVANVCGPAPSGDAGKPHGAEADASAEVAAAAPDATPGASDIGQACQTSRDCKVGLACIPTTGGAAVCDLASFGLTAGAKTCTGECSSAADCCELPAGISVYGYVDGGYVYAQNCTDIFAGVLGGSTAPCVNPPSGSTMSNACFFYQTYCNCMPGAWACSGGRCAYTAPCRGQYGNQLGGCPSLSRAGAALDTTCNLSSASCAASACATAAGCDGLHVVDRSAVTCRGGDCACLGSGCYLKCTRDADCDPGYSCDATRTVCVPSACTSDAQCFSQLGMARAKCSGGACGIPCKVDLDCSPSGDLPGQPFNGTVCGPGGTCVAVGCSSDADCSRTGSGPRRFCVASPGTVRSAVSN